MDQRNRNLLDYQRGVVAIKLETLLRPKAKERLVTSTGGKAPRPLTKSTKADPQENPIEPAIEEQAAPVHVRKEVAKAAGLSEDTIRKVKVIEEQATPEQKQRLLDNRASINKVYEEIAGLADVSPSE